MATIYAKNKQTGEWERVGPAANATDSTLTLAGSPADAKATGEAIDNIQIRIENLTAEDVGALPSSTEIPSIEGLASEAYVNGRIDEKISEVVGSAPELLNTLDELSAALNDDENFATTVANQIATKQDKLTFDEVPTADSTNPVTSGGIKSYVDESIILKDTEIKLPASSRWLSICYGNEKFVAVGNNRKAAYSTDGTTWHETSMPSYEKWAKVVYGEDKFVALSFSNIAYSTDGITWSSVTLPSTTNSSHSWSDLAYGNGVFVITARSSTGSNPTSDYVYSTDGINWTKSNLPDALSYPHIAYGNGKFITCSGGVISSDRIYCSEDGINWSYMTYTSSINNRGISYVGDKFIIKTDSSGLENLYSTDGITWNTMSTGLNTTTYSPSYCYGNGMYVAVTSHSTTDRIQYNGIALYSTDGITWTQTTMPFKCSSDVAYGNGKFVALHNYSDSYDVSTDTIMYSDDGINWRSGMSQLQTIGGENVTDDVLGALKHTHPEYETGGVQSNLSQTDSTQVDYVKGVIRKESLPEGYPYKEGSKTVIEWDGNTEGKFFFGNDVSGACKVSNETFDDLSGFPITFMWGDESEELTLSERVEAMGNVYIYSTSAAQTTVLVVLGENAQNLETGTYFFIGSEYGYVKYVSKLTYGTGTIHHIAPEFLPEGYPYKEIIPATIIDNETISFVNQDGLPMDMSHSFELVPGQTYKVIWDGTEYNCNCLDFGGGAGVIGNLSVLGGVDTGEPFLFMSNAAMKAIVSTSGEGDHIVSLIANVAVYHTADPNYLPIVTEENAGVIKFYRFNISVSAAEAKEAVDAFNAGQAILNWNGANLIHAHIDTSDNSLHVIKSYAPGIMYRYEYLHDNGGCYNESLRIPEHIGIVRANNLYIGDYTITDFVNEELSTQLATKQNTLTITDDGAGNVVIS